MNIELPSIKNYPPYDFSKLKQTISTNIAKLKNGSNRKPNTFYDDLTYFREHWIDQEQPQRLSTNQLRSVSIHLVESRNSFEELLNKDLLLELVEQMSRDENVGTIKRMVQLYFAYYLVLKEHPVDIEKIKLEIKKALKKYKGNNYLLKIYKENIKVLFEPTDIKRKYGSFEKIWIMLNLSPQSDYYRFLLILELIDKLEKLDPGSYEQELFENIFNYKNFPYDSQLMIGEYAVKVLISKMMAEKNHAYKKWINIIIDLVGDPRTVSIVTAQNASWERIGKKYKEFLIGFLSKEDLNLFLEVLSDSEYDSVYKYRKTFWKPFAKHLRFAKLFINNREFSRLEDTIKQRFNDLGNSAYSFISDTQRSFIYMDFGNVVVIEGTHNAKVRLYIDTPVPLELKFYEYRDFYQSTQAQQVLIKEIVHRGSEIGTWQNKVFSILKERIPRIGITLSETLL